MFGIGGGELILIIFVALMLFGADKIPEIARTLAQIMAQFKNATNDIKNEIQKSAEEHGFDQKSLNNLTGNISNEIEKVKENLLSDMPNPVQDVSFELDKIKENILADTTNKTEELKKNPEEVIEDIEGPIKRSM